MVLMDLKETNVLVHPPIYPWSVPLKDNLLTEILLPYIFGQLKHQWMWVNNLFIVPDFQPVKTYFVFSVHTMSMSLSAWHKTPAFCGQCCSRKTKPHCQLHMRTLRSSCDIDERLHPDGLWIFFFLPPLKNIRTSCFCSEVYQGYRWKSVLWGFLSRSEVCALFFYSQAWTHPRGEDVSKYF